MTLAKGLNVIPVERDGFLLNNGNNSREFYLTELSDVIISDAYELRGNSFTSGMYSSKEAIFISAHFEASKADKEQAIMSAGIALVLLNELLNTPSTKTMQLSVQLSSM